MGAPITKILEAGSPPFNFTTAYSLMKVCDLFLLLLTDRPTILACFSNLISEVELLYRQIQTSSGLIGNFDLTKGNLENSLDWDGGCDLSDFGGNTCSNAVR